MTDRVKTFWIPGAVGFLAATLLEQVLFVAGARPWIVHQGQYGALGCGSVLINPMLLVLLPACGALAAWLARRSGTSINRRIAAAEVPALMMAASLLGTAILVFDVGLVSPGYVRPVAVLGGLAAYLPGFAILPGISLLLGALPFLGSRDKMQAFASSVP